MSTFAVDTEYQYRLAAVAAFVTLITLVACGSNSIDANQAPDETNTPLNTILVNEGDGQHGAAGAAVAIAPSVVVKNANGTPTPGVRVTFAVSSGGNVAVNSQVTDVRGVATTGWWILGMPAGAQTVTASSIGAKGSPITFTAIATISNYNPLVSITTGGSHTCSISADGAAQCWGLNSEGQLGDGTTTSRLRPTAVSGGLSFKSINAGYAHTCALTSNGAAYCWGRNLEGEAGDGTTSLRRAPVPVASSETFMSITARGFHTCGITIGGKAYCWGLNAHGQLGDNSTVSRPTPAAVAASFAFSSITAGSYHTCGLNIAGSAFCWGGGQYNDGEVGDGSGLNRSSPVAVSGGRTFVLLTAGFSHNCGLTTSGLTYCWGVNKSRSVSSNGGQLGDGSTTSSSVPVLVSGGQVFVRLAAGGDHTCGTTIDQTTFCWGGNFDGQLGVGALTPSYTTPHVIDSHFGFAYLASGSRHTCGLTWAGSGYCWGANNSGQIGDASTETKYTPWAVQR